METTEKIVESYCRYVKGWFTLPNIKCVGQYEVDLLAVDACKRPIERYHIESGVSISGAYSKLTGKKFSQEELYKRSGQAGQRRTVGYFSQRKFGSEQVCSELANYGFMAGSYTKVIVTWGWTEDAKKEADREGITLWDFRRPLVEIDERCRNKTYFTDDTLRTIQLFRNRNLGLKGEDIN